MIVDIKRGSRSLAACSMALVGMFDFSIMGYYHQQNPQQLISNKRELRREFGSMGIVDTVSAQRHIEEYFQSGMRQEYQQMYIQLACMPQRQLEEYIKRVPPTSTEFYRLELVRKMLHRMPSGGISALDYIRGIYVAYGGHRLGWLTQEQRETYCIEAVTGIRNDYTNWRDVILAFTIGYAFDKAQEKRVLGFYPPHIHLLTSRYSLIHNMSLWA